MKKEAQVFDAHLMVFKRPRINWTSKGLTLHQIKIECGICIKSAEHVCSILRGMEGNHYMQERAADIRDVSNVS